MLRELEEDEGADEDDDMFFPGIKPANEYPWYRLSHWVERNSLGYDVIEGFVLVALLIGIIWVCWGCLVTLGVCPDDRLDNRRDMRMVRDGRGVFAPISTVDPSDDKRLMEDDDSDDASRESMEYGRSHLDKEEYDDGIDAGKEEKRLLDAADGFFNRPAPRPGPKVRFSEELVEDTLLDLEMIEKPPGATPKPDVAIV